MTFILFSEFCISSCYYIYKTRNTLKLKKKYPIALFQNFQLGDIENLITYFILP